MLLAPSLALASAALALYVAALARRMSLAPGWRDQAWFALIAVMSAAYAVGNAFTGTPTARVGWIVPLSRLQLAAVLVQVWAWFRYYDDRARRAPSRGETAAVNALLAVAALALVPGVAYGGAVRTHAFAGAQYRDAVPTQAGEAMFAVALLAAAVVIARFVVAWLEGAKEMRATALGLGALVFCGLNDATVASGVSSGPYLLDVGFVVPVLAVGWSLTSRFVEEARALDGLRRRLVVEVEERTRELAQAHGALHLAEKLAALGQFAAGVGHEVNNPAAVVTANLQYLAGTCTAGPPPDDAGDAVRESLDAMRRINELVRKLVDAGRIAAAPPSEGSASVAEAVRVAIEEARPRASGHVRFEAAIDPELHARAKPEMLQHVLFQILANAAESVPPARPGRVEVSAAMVAGRIRIRVRDDGAGMASDVLRRAFDPFFSTKPTGRGSGLGLPVSRGLVESHGGELRLESEPGRGTTAVIELPVAVEA